MPSTIIFRMQIYVRSDRKDYGPYSLEQLRDLVANGTFVHHDSAFVAGSGKMTIIEKIPGFQIRLPKSKAVDKPICPYCRTEVEAPKIQCPTCSSPHHRECWSQNGGCTVYGCKSSPSDEPKMVITHQSLARTAPRPVSQDASGHRRSGGYRLRNQCGNESRTIRIPHEQSSFRTSALPAPRQYGGIGRLGYAGLLFLSFFGVGFISGMLNSGGPVLLLIPLFYMLTAYRLKNIGDNPWCCLLMLIPIVNLILQIRCLLFQEGYADTKRLDAAGKTISWLLFSIFILLVLAAIIGAPEYHW